MAVQPGGHVAAAAQPGIDILSRAKTTISLPSWDKISFTESLSFNTGYKVQHLLALRVGLK